MLQVVRELLTKGRQNAIRSVNNILLKTYWNIGKVLVEFEQKGAEKAEYGSKLLSKISSDLKLWQGKGFSRRNLSDMRRFYISYPIWQTLSAKLSWSHYISILRISNKNARNFYEKTAINDHLSVREMERQINSMLFERISLSKSETSIQKLIKHGQIIEKSEDIIKDPYIFEFLQFSEKHLITEKVLEQKLIDNLQMFMLELGKGFSLVGRQYRISLGNDHYYVDLVFYHRILKCFFLIDLKVGKVKHSDIGQMNLYLNYFNKEELVPGDNRTIGVVLGAEKDEFEMEYALGGITNKLFVSKYQLYLPNKNELEKRLFKSF